MNARRWAGAALMACAAASHAQDGATVYGRLNVGAEQVRAATEGGSANTQRLSNYRSVLGWRGSEDLGDGFKAIWQIEGALALDTGTGNIANRDSRVGLAGQWGTLFAGQWTLPYTAVTAPFDPFYATTAGYMALLGNGSAASANNVSNTSAFDRRQQNVVQYWAPEWAGVATRVAYAFGEETSAATGARPSLVSASASYQASAWQWVAAYELHRRYQAATGSDHGIKLGARFSASGLRIAVVFERLAYATAGGSLRRDAGYVSAVYRLGAVSLQGGLGKAMRGRGATAATSVGNIASGDETGATHATFGVDYAFSGRTSAFAFFSRIRNEHQAHYDFAINESGAARGTSPSVLAIGLRHSF